MKRTKFIETLSMQDLEEKGYKQRYDGTGWYLGNSKFPTHRINKSQEALLGRRFKIEGLKGELILVEGHGGNSYYIPPHLIKTQITKMRPAKIIFRDEVVTYHGYGFEFPCAMRSMGEQEAIRMARWVLKVTKAGG